MRISPRELIHNENSAQFSTINFIARATEKSRVKYTLEPVLIVKGEIPCMLLDRLGLLVCAPTGAWQKEWRTTLAKGFTLVSAPAGYGKTTLISSWLRETGIPTAWLSLEEADNDPVRFLQYLLTALHYIVSSIHCDLLNLVEGIQPASLQALMHILINEIAMSHDRFVLVLDDFHQIQDSSILDMITYLLDHLPAEKCTWC